ncbi:MAG: hypothetical protein QME68_08875, partial [Elusimicrobiota bacterium]|nr:hypothetical protein [Elusimicrobiota bacterium]
MNNKIFWLYVIITGLFVSLPFAEPEAVTNLSVTIGFKRVTLSWSAPYDSSASTTGTEATLTWQAVTENTDGTVCDNLSGENYSQIIKFLKNQGIY